MGKRLSTQEFIERAEKVHGKGKYDYSEVEYVNVKTFVKIRCLKHNHWFTQLPESHLRGSRCDLCVKEERSLEAHSSQAFTTEAFVAKARQVHGDTYGYDKVEYYNNNTKVWIYCKRHGEYFQQQPNNHLQGKGCPRCARERTASKQRDDTETFIRKAKALHGDKYDYTLVEYISSTVKVKIRCREHNHIFEQTPSSHLSGCGCPVCRTSQGEKRVAEILDKYNIKYITQKRFIGCKFQRPLPFDFYLPEYNQTIEYQGIQHYKKFNFFGGHEGFLSLRIRDAIKKNYCKQKNIKFLEIPYWDFENIEKIINETIRS